MYKLWVNRHRVCRCMMSGVELMRDHVVGMGTQHALSVAQFLFVLGNVYMFSLDELCLVMLAGLVLGKF